MAGAGSADDLVARSGIAGVTSVERLSAGLGGNDLWRLRRSAGDLVLRAFPRGAPVTRARREEQAHRYARDSGLAAPRVHACRMIDDRPMLIMDWVPGTRVAERLWSGDDPDDLGRRSGAVLAALHSADGPPPALVAARSWVDWPEPMPEVGPLLQAYDTGRVVLHLDFHPENLIIAEDGVITVLDWANCVVGPPEADLARTLSVLELIMAAVPGLPETARRAIDRYREGFLAGYLDAGGKVAIPRPVQAWAYAGQRRDMTGSWVPPWYLDQLDVRCRELIGTSPT